MSIVRAIFQSKKRKEHEENEPVERQLQNVIGNLETLEKFLGDVKGGKKGKDPKMAKRIKQLLNMGLDLSTEEINGLLTKNSQDIAMISYLCDLVSTQGVVQDKLNKFIVSVLK